MHGHVANCSHLSKTWSGMRSSPSLAFPHFTKCSELRQKHAEQCSGWQNAKECHSAYQNRCLPNVDFWSRNCLLFPCRQILTGWNQHVASSCKPFFPRTRTPCGHGAQVIVEGREERQMVENGTKTPKNQPKTKHPSPQADSTIL